MLSLGGVHHLTGGSKKEGRITCDTLLALCNKQAVELVKAGAADYLSKPWDDQRLLVTVRNLLELAESNRQARKLTVFFQGDTLARFEGDEMPSETEFVATLGSHKGKPKVPSLEATEAQLARYPARKAEAAAAPAAPAPSAPTPGRYPPLESSSR